LVIFVCVEFGKENETYSKISENVYSLKCHIYSPF
jgi:hypothetical protein